MMFLQRLKCQNWSIDDGVQLTMEHGFIGDIRIQVPWTHLQSGQIKITVDRVHIVLRPQVQGHDFYKANEGTKQSAKMVISCYLSV
jgi:hypothetical protein